MSNISAVSRITVLAVGIAGALAFSQAHAAAFQLKENSAKAQGRAFAGSGSAPDDAAIIANNPAGMRLLDGRQFQIDASTISFGAKFSGDASYATGGAIGGGNGGDAGKIAVVPAAYFHQPFGENNNLHFGTSLTVPYGFETKYDSNWAGRYSGIKTKLQAIDLSLAFSYDVNPYVSFGASVFAERLDIDLSNAIDFGTALYSGYGVSAPGAADGSLRIKADNTELGYTLGGLFSIDENTNIGFSYRSAVKHKITGGDAYFTLPTAYAALLSTTYPSQTTGNANLTLPAVATASFFHRIDERWSVMADVSRTAWSKFDEVNVVLKNGLVLPLEFNYRDTTFASIGADYRLNETVTLRGGLAYDQTPTTSENRDVRVPDATRKWLSLGVSWAPSPKTEYNLGYTHLFTSDPSIDSTTSTYNTIVGSYEVTGDVLAASFNYKF
ncbi:MAG: outer membrane protein transport protein [Pseudomonas sp.]